MKDNPGFTEEEKQRAHLFMEKITDPVFLKSFESLLVLYQSFLAGMKTLGPEATARLQQAGCPYPVDKDFIDWAKSTARILREFKEFMQEEKENDGNT